STPPLSHYTYTLSLHDALPISSVSYYKNLSGFKDLTGLISLECGHIGFVARLPYSFHQILLGNQTGIVGYLNSTRAEVHGGFCRSEEHTSELQSRFDLVCRLLL